MRAIGLTEFGGPEVLRVIELPDPVPGTRRGAYPRARGARSTPPTRCCAPASARAWFKGRPGPYVPGMDAAGVVDAIGPDTDTPLRPGDAVITIVHAYGPRGGAYAELVVVPAESVVPIPSDADFPAASTLLMNALTARVALDLAGRSGRRHRRGDRRGRRVRRIRGAAGQERRAARAGRRFGRRHAAGGRAWAPTRSCPAATTSPSGSARSPRTGWTPCSTGRR